MIREKELKGVILLTALYISKQRAFYRKKIYINWLHELSSTEWPLHGCITTRLADWLHNSVYNMSDRKEDLSRVVGALFEILRQRGSNWLILVWLTVTPIQKRPSHPIPLKGNVWGCNNSRSYSKPQMSFTFLKLCIIQKKCERRCAAFFNAKEQSGSPDSSRIILRCCYSNQLQCDYTEEGKNS